MQILIILACAAISFWGVWAFLKFVWEPGNTESLKRKAYIRDLEWQKKQLDAGINPNGMPFDYDRSCDLHNYNCICEDCKRVSAENQKRVERDAAILETLY